MFLALLIELFGYQFLTTLSRMCDAGSILACKPSSLRPAHTSCLFFTHSRVHSAAILSFSM